MARRLANVAVLALAGVLSSFSLWPKAWANEAAPAKGTIKPDVVVERVNALVRAGWQSHGVAPSPRATDAEWCRRVYLDLVGRVPTVEELDAFATKKSAVKRAELVDRLLGAKYSAEFARNWKTIWTNLLLGRTGGREPRSLVCRAGMEQYLEGCFQENKPYDQMVRELVTATGDARPEMERYNGAVNFLVGKLADDGVQATAKTAQLFLGQSVQCTQCHNHPFSDARQSQFWELNAFFRQARVEERRMEGGDRTRYATLVDRDFAGEGRTSGGDQRREIFLTMRNGKLVDRDAAQASSAPIFYELRNGQVAVAYPAFVDGTSLAERFADKGPDYGNSGKLALVNRREELAKLILASPQLVRACANRMWGHFLGYGFTKPVDDMGPHNPANMPEALDELASRFRESGFDLRDLMRWIVLSEPYSLSSRAGAGNAEDDPDKGKPPLFSRFYVRPMEAEELYESLLVATEADATVDKGEREAIKERWLEQLSRAFGNDEGTESTTFNGSIPQALMLMNGDLVRRACSTEGGGFLEKVAHNERLLNREKIGYLYRAALGRPPGEDEAAIASELLAARGGDVVQTLADVWWAVLNSNEFILIH